MDGGESVWLAWRCLKKNCQLAMTVLCRELYIRTDYTLIEMSLWVSHTDYSRCLLWLPLHHRTVRLKGKLYTPWLLVDLVWSYLLHVSGTAQTWKKNLRCVFLQLEKTLLEGLKIMLLNSKSPKRKFKKIKP